MSIETVTIADISCRCWGRRGPDARGRCGDPGGL